MSKWRVQLKIEGKRRWLSHLDILSLVERGLRRAGLPVAYSQGYNPHMLISWGPAHPVGLAGDGEYFDIEFAGDVGGDWYHGINEVLPEGVEIINAKSLGERTPALMSSINLATYRITFPEDMEREMEEGVKALINRTALVVTRRSPKGEKTADIRPGIIDLHCEGRDLLLTATINTGQSPKPQEVAKEVIKEREPEYICRTGLYIKEGQEITKP